MHAPSLLAVLLALSLPAAAHLGDHGPASATRERASKPVKKPPAAPKDDEKWDVNVPHGPHRTIAFDTDEATWLSVDVSPDGRTLVIDVFGDLYTLPIEGGQATRITSGLAYDCQPRWSPDGTRIAFTSDRSGCDNLWTVAPDGSEPRQVSHEDEVTLCCSAWSPEGQWLAGRKRLTDTSSLGTVELWLYHVDGGKGVQVTKKDDLPDANDPVFARDGRFLYYSARPSRYEYDKNVFQGIWQVRRHDTVTGEAVPITSSGGGSCRPQVSPDGRTLALIRRSGTQTHLVLHDLESGSERVLDRAMERDLQEGFAQGGTYPWYAFTPDGRAIVASAQGKLWQIDIASGRRTAIPFTVRVEQVVVDALRFPVDLAAGTFTARINRWPALSPGGTSVVFSSVGKLWRKDLNTGAIAPVDDSADLQYCPSFAPNGDLLLASWTDAFGGFVSRIPAGGGPASRLTRVGGHVANPVASPDGSKVAYVRGSGAPARGEELGDELWHELRVLDVATGADSFLRTVSNRGSARRMPRPSWSADGARLYYQDDEPGKDHGPTKTVLRSIQLDGTDRRDHLTFPYAEELIVSPDERWVAVNEQHDVYLVALPRAGQPIVEVGLSDAAVPRIQLVNEGGDFPRWTADGAEITWSSGPNFGRAKVSEVLAWARRKAAKSDGDAEDESKDTKKEEKADDLPPSTATPFGLELPAWRPRGVVAYEHGRLLLMDGERIVEDGTVVVDGDRIVAVGRSADVRIPEGAERVDLSGKTVMPGLVDVHAHLHYGSLDVFPQREWRYDANLAYGVTTVFDPSASTHGVFGMAEMVRAGRMVGPRVFSTGFILYGADIPNKAPVKSLDDARHHVRRMKALGAIAVKSYMQPARRQRQWLLEAARDEKVMVVPEGGGHYEMDMTFILDGHTKMEHAIPVTPLYRDVVELWARTEVGYTPTLLVAYGGLSGEHWFYQHAEVWRDEKLLRFTPRGIIEGRARRRPVMAADDDWHHQEVAASAKKIVDAGGSVELGAHGQLQGLGPHWELWAMAQGGMTPWQVLRAGTIDAARSIGLGDEIGSLERGKLADFIVLGGDPLADIQQTNTVEQVIVGGRRFDAGTMDETWPARTPRPRYFWQGEAEPGAQPSAAGTVSSAP